MIDQQHTGSRVQQKSSCLKALTFLVSRRKSFVKESLGTGRRIFCGKFARFNPVG